jgi:hypothetical protein
MAYMLFPELEQQVLRGLRALSFAAGGRIIT